MIRVASIFAKSGDARRDYQLGAIGIRADGAFVLSRNEGTKVRTFPAHAEARLIRKLGKNATMVIVVRIAKDGKLAMAKPCVHCEQALRNLNVKKVYYTTANGIEMLW